MKLLIIICSVMFLIGCSEFPTKYQRIDTNEYRVLDFVYEPAEAAPGDTVRVKAIFAGKKISPADIDWKVSFNVIQNGYGTIDTAFDLKPINPSPVETHFSDKTTCMEFSIVIPSDIMYTSGGIPENWSTLISSDYKDIVPAEYLGLSKSQLLDTLGSLLNLDPTILGLLVVDKPELEKTIPLFCQFMAVRVRLFADIRNDHVVESDYTVRYNSHFSVSGIDVAVNSNPRIDSLGICKVAGNITDYNFEENRHEFFRLDVPVGQERTILIDKNYSYFVKVFTNAPDTSRTLVDIMNGTSQPEKLYSQWYYQLADDETKDVSVNDFMDISDTQLLEYLVPPSSKSIKNFTIWAQVYDDLLNENLRPFGSSLIEGRGKFEYTQAYLDNVNKK
jgi:hypothetical protein